jgi:hypothetical protein
MNCHYTLLLTCSAGRLANRIAIRAVLQDVTREDGQAVAHFSENGTGIDRLLSVFERARGWYGNGPTRAKWRAPLSARRSVLTGTLETTDIELRRRPETARQQHDHRREQFDGKRPKLAALTSGCR